VSRESSLLLGLDGTTAVAEDIGRQIVTSGRRLAPQEIGNSVQYLVPGALLGARVLTSVSLG
jgi:processing peptidase subunit beta